MKKKMHSQKICISCSYCKFLAKNHLWGFSERILNHINLRSHIHAPTHPNLGRNNDRRCARSLEKEPLLFLLLRLSRCLGLNQLGLANRLAGLRVHRSHLDFAALLLGKLNSNRGCSGGNRLAFRGR
jgi:hypothetical protein